MPTIQSACYTYTPVGDASPSYSPSGSASVSVAARKKQDIVTETWRRLLPCSGSWWRLVVSENSCL